MTVRKRLFAALVLLAVVLGIAGLAILSQPREPSYNGKSLTEWLRILERATEEDKTNAQLAVRSIGSNAIPTLVRMAQARDTSLKRAIRTAKRKLAIVDIHIGTPESQRIRAAIGFWVLGESAAPAIPSLAELLDHEETYATAVLSLMELGTGGVSHVTRMLTNPINDRAELAVSHLASIGLELRDTNLSVASRTALEHRADMAVPPLVDCLKNTSFPFRSEAAEALGLIGRQPNIVTPVLSNILATATPSNEVITAVIRALARFGRPAQSVSPVIRPFLNHADENVRRAATNTLARINADESPARSAE